MAAYFTQLRQASFRGLSFGLPDDESTFGRRIVTHQFPGRDDPFHEDLGLDLKIFKVEAIIFGDNFMADAGAFEAALSQRGPGLLIHPYYGQVSAVVKTTQRRHSEGDVGEVRFSITFERDKPVAQPSAASNTAAGLTTAAQNAYGFLSSDFLKNFTIAGMPDFVTQDGLTRAAAFTDELKTVLRTRSLLGLAGAIFPTFAVSDPSSLAGQVTGLFQDIASITLPSSPPAISSDASAPPAPANAVTLMQALGTTSQNSIADTSSAGTSVQTVRVANATALDLIFRGSSLAAATAAAAQADYESREQALSVRNDLAADYSALMDDLGAAGWDDSWKAAADMYAALCRDINERIGRLPQTVTVHNRTVRASLNLANRLYGDDPGVIIAEAEDIAVRNAIRHPGFVPVADLEVLIDAAT